MNIPYNIYWKWKYSDIIVFSIPNLDVKSLKLDINKDELIISWRTFNAIDNIIKKDFWITDKLSEKKGDLFLEDFEFSEKITFDWLISESESKARFDKWFLIIEVIKQNKTWFITLTTNK